MITKSTSLSSALMAILPFSVHTEWRMTLKIAIEAVILVWYSFFFSSFHFVIRFIYSTFCCCKFVYYAHHYLLNNLRTFVDFGSLHSLSCSPAEWRLCGLCTKGVLKFIFHVLLANITTVLALFCVYFLHCMTFYSSIIMLLPSASNTNSYFLYIHIYATPLAASSHSRPPFICYYIFPCALIYMRSRSWKFHPSH